MDQWLNASLEKLDKYGTDVTINKGIFECNRVGFYIFLTSNDPKLLNNALKYMYNARSSDVSKDFTTRATLGYLCRRLLYKVGRTNEAIQWEEKL